jgi:hypothetical protein
MRGARPRPRLNLIAHRLGALQAVAGGGTLTGAAMSAYGFGFGFGAGFGFEGMPGRPGVLGP